MALIISTFIPSLHLAQAMSARHPYHRGQLHVIIASPIEELHCYPLHLHDDLDHTNNAKRLSSGSSGGRLRLNRSISLD